MVESGLYRIVQIVHLDRRFSPVLYYHGRIVLPWLIQIKRFGRTRDLRHLGVEYFQAVSQRAIWRQVGSGFCATVFRFGFGSRERTLRARKVQENISQAGVHDIASRLEQLKGLLTVRELRTHLNLSKTTLYDKVQQGTVPYLRFGTTIRFDPVRIAIWLREQEVCGNLPKAA